MSKIQSNKNKRGKYQVTLHNDKYNTFEHVNNCLIDACGHNDLQAHQCALIVHNVGRCVIFVDSYSECEVVHDYLIENHLKVTIEKYDTKNS